MRRTKEVMEGGLGGHKKAFELRKRRELYFIFCVKGIFQFLWPNIIYEEQSRNVIKLSLRKEFYVCHSFNALTVVCDKCYFGKFSGWTTNVIKSIRDHQVK